MATIHINEQSPPKLRISVNDVFELELEETPTTGYRWEIRHLDPDQLRLISEEYLHYPRAGIGGGGKKIYKFKVLSKGSGQLKLENRQSWSGDIYKVFDLEYVAD